MPAKLTDLLTHFSSSYLQRIERERYRDLAKLHQIDFHGSNSTEEDLGQNDNTAVEGFSQQPWNGTELKNVV